VRVTDPNPRAALRRALLKLFRVYGNRSFDVTTTCNAVIKANHAESFSVYYGQDFGALTHRDQSVGGEIVTVHNLGDCDLIPTVFTSNDFADVFDRTFQDTDASVHSLISIIFKFSALLSNYERDKRVTQSWSKLF
jgi:hypothetical protein